MRPVVSPFRNRNYRLYLRAHRSSVEVTDASNVQKGFFVGASELEEANKLSCLLPKPNPELADRFAERQHPLSVRDS